MLNPVIGLASSAISGLNPGTSADKHIGASASPSLTGVVSELANSLMPGGKVDLNSPLGKMVYEKLGDKGMLGVMSNPKEALQNAFLDIIKDTMGSNFVANAGMRDSKDLMTQVMGGLGQSALNNALQPKGDGTTFSKADKPLLQQVADYMDKNKAAFGAPDSGSWSKELDEDNYLSKGETAKFKQALDQVSQQLGITANRAGSPASERMMGGGLGGLGGSPAQAVGGMSELEQLRQVLGSEGKNIFQQGLQLGLEIASGTQHGLQLNHGGQSVSQAAQNVLDVMRSSILES